MNLADICHTVLQTRDSSQSSHAVNALAGIAAATGRDDLLREMIGRLLDASAQDEGVPATLRNRAAS